MAVNMTTIVLAGGASSRMGQDKRLLPLAGKTLLEWVIEGAAPFSREVILVGNQPVDLPENEAPCRWIPDAYPSLGPLGGIYSGLVVSATELNFVIACDMPFINIGLVRFMVEHCEDTQVVATEAGGHLEPFHAIYRRNCAPEIRGSLEAKELKIGKFFSKVRSKILPEVSIAEYDPAGLCFFNVNTPSDYVKAQELLLSADI